MKFLIFCGVVATILIMCSGCETPAKKIPCRDTVPATLHTVEEVETYKCSNYYAEKEALRIEAQERMETLLGSHDFFLRDGE